MGVIVVANAKGGVGKSTVASNVAGYLARQGHRVMLGDVDAQQSARHWLQLRPEGLPTIESWAVEGDRLRPPSGVQWVVLDTPAGFQGRLLEQAVGLAQHVVVPLQPSLFDAQATLPFVRTVQKLAGKRKVPPAIGLVSVRQKEGTQSSLQLQQFLAGAGLEPIAAIRDTQNYVQLAARGLTLWDVGPSRVERDLEQWQPLLQWLGV
ncbi:ParA family protein [Inhella gelatinilytica]|uniref:ParA family protein n=1 Tax=Inhella gelatinilytica TaxID=2795030 RepID=A0A931NEC6_9BURK|nr:ParA family protein [Inhella gelatinilytica]MBH9553534.1 ParA family protein [Inhella gelatinilytica]